MLSPGWSSVDGRWGNGSRRSLRVQEAGLEDITPGCLALVRTELELEAEAQYGRTMSTEEHGKLRTFLNIVGTDPVLVDKWWHGGHDGHGGADAFAGDSKVGRKWTELGETYQALLREGDLCKIKEALDNEALEMGEDSSAHLPSWALVRI